MTLPERMRFRAGTGKEGFTLIELMIALFILGLLFTGVYRVYISQEAMFRAQEQISQAQQNLRATSEFLNQEMSWMGYQSLGVAVTLAAVNEVIFNANIPNLGATVRYVRYKHDDTNETLLRAVGSTQAFVQDDNNLRILSSDVDVFDLTYYDGTHAAMSITVGNPLVSPTDDIALGLIRQIQTNLTIKAARPDWKYTGYADHYRRRSAVIDVKLRNIEDVTATGGMAGTGSCSTFTMDVTYPGAAGKYEGCSDQQDILGSMTPNLLDNPVVTITVVDPDGNPENNTPVSLYADNNYYFVNSAGNQTAAIINRTNGIGSLYLVAGNLANVSEGTIVTVKSFFTPPEGGCIQDKHTEPLTIISGSASRFDTQAPYDASPIIAEYVDLGTGNPLLPQPASLPVCSAASNEGIRYRARLEDSCDNGIEGQTVQFSAAQGSFQTGTQDNGDGTYEIVYVPPDNMAAVAATDQDTVTVTWVEGSESHQSSVTLVPGAPDHIVVEDITGPAGYGFVKTGSNSFAMQRVNNQLAQVNLSVMDQCGNRVFGEENNTTTSTTYGTTSPFPYPTPEVDGTYTFNWITPDSCGAGISGESIEIAHGSTAPETVTFDLLTTPETVLNLAFEVGIGAPDADLFAGGNAPGCLDQVLMSASVLENTGQDECHNLTDPFTAEFMVAGQFAALGNGSFDPSAAISMIPAASDASGKAWATLYNGEALWNQKLNVTAVIYVDGAPSFPGPPVPQEVQMKGTAPDVVRSGMYATTGYTASDVRGLLRANRSFAAGDMIYPRMIDCDENERRASQDPDPILPITKVTLESLLTGDVVRVPLVENLANDADFRTDTSFFPGSGVVTELSAVADTGDDVLQVRYGDLVTMNYSDKDSIIGTAPDPFAFFNTAAISGPRWIELYYVDQSPPNNETLIIPGFDLTDGDWYRPKMYFPEFEGDTLPDVDGDGTQDGFGTMTITAEARAYVGGEADVFTLREVDNTGVFVTDAVKYGVDYNTVSKGLNPAAPVDEIWLHIPYTPERVTVYYPDLSSPLQTNSFMVRDTDLPDVSVAPPAVDAGIIPIDVFADDVWNLIDPGIDFIELYIDGINVRTWVHPADTLAPPVTVTYDWVTESLGQVFWLNGQHTVHARARDKAGNWNQSPDIIVTVNNPGSTDITFTQPAPNGHYSQTVTVVVQAPDLFDPVSQTYTCSLSAAPNPPADVTMASDNTCTFNWDTSPILDNLYSLSVVVTDNQGNVETTASNLDIYVDNTGPTVTFYDAPGTWIGTVSSYPVDFRVIDNPGPPNGAGVAATTVQFFATGDCGSDSGPASPLGGDDFRFVWAPSCPAVEGSQTWSVDALDQSVGPNNGTGSITVNVDTIPPVMGTLTATPVAGDYLGATGYFVKGVVTLDSVVQDTYASTASVIIDNLSGSPVTIGRPLDNPATGAFHYTWNTSAWAQTVYEVTPHGTDLAGNTDVGTAPATFYVDRTPPSIVGPTIASYVTSVENVTMSADAVFGHLSNLGLLVYDSSMARVYTDIGYLPSSAAVVSTTITTQLDSRGALVNGTYYIQGYARDHAANATSTDPGLRPFEVCNRYATINTVTWAPNGVNWSLLVAGSLVQLAGTPDPPIQETGAMLLTINNYGQPPGAPTTWSDPFTTDAPGHFTYNNIVTSGSILIVPGDTVEVVVRNTDSLCDPGFPGKVDWDSLGGVL